jgi:hypothetical protein
MPVFSLPLLLEATFVTLFDVPFVADARRQSRTPRFFTRPMFFPTNGDDVAAVNTAVLCA